MGKSVVFDVAPDCRCYRGEFVVGEVNCRHGPDIVGRHLPSKKRLDGLICQRLEGEMIEARNRNKVTPSHSHALQSGAWIEREQTSRGCASMNTDLAELERYMIFEGVIQWTQAVASV